MLGSIFLFSLLEKGFVIWVAIQSEIAICPVSEQQLSLLGCSQWFCCTIRNDEWRKHSGLSQSERSQRAGISEAQTDYFLVNTTDKARTINSLHCSEQKKEPCTLVRRHAFFGLGPKAHEQDLFTNGKCSEPFHMILIYT